MRRLRGIPPSLAQVRLKCANYSVSIKQLVRNWHIVKKCPATHC